MRSGKYLLRHLSFNAISRVNWKRDSTFRFLTRFCPHCQNMSKNHQNLVVSRIIGIQDWPLKSILMMCVEKNSNFLRNIQENSPEDRLFTRQIMFWTKQKLLVLVDFWKTPCFAPVCINLDSQMYISKKLSERYAKGLIIQKLFESRNIIRK